MPKEEGCPSCEHAGKNCGGHWSKVKRPKWYGDRETNTRSKPNLDTTEGNSTR